MTTPSVATAPQVNPRPLLDASLLGEQARQTVEAAGAVFLGLSENLVWFRDPQTGTSLVLEPGELSVLSVARRLLHSRALFLRKAQPAWSEHRVS